MKKGEMGRWETGVGGVAEIVRCGRARSRVNKEKNGEGLARYNWRGIMGAIRLL